MSSFKLISFSVAISETWFYFLGKLRFSYSAVWGYLSQFLLWHADQRVYEIKQVWNYPLYHSILKIKIYDIVTYCLMIYMDRRYVFNLLTH